MRPRFHLLSLPLILGATGCQDIRVGSPSSLWLLWLVPLMVAFYVFTFRSSTLLLRRFASPELLARLTAGVSRPRQYFKAILVLLGLVATVLALAELKYGFTWEEVTREGVDIVVALDVSDSMLVEDAGSAASSAPRARSPICSTCCRATGSGWWPLPAPPFSSAR